MSMVNGGTAIEGMLVVEVETSKRNQAPIAEEVAAMGAYKAPLRQRSLLAFGRRCRTNSQRERQEASSRDSRQEGLPGEAFRSRHRFPNEKISDRSWKTGEDKGCEAALLIPSSCRLPMKWGFEAT